MDTTLHLEMNLTAAIVGLVHNEPSILLSFETHPHEQSLPSGRFEPLQHRTLERALRDFVQAQTGETLGYVEQLYTFGDRGRHAMPGDKGAHVVSVGYLALVRPSLSKATKSFGFAPCYRSFPWEDWRQGRPPI